jgi:hypothetical protein
MTNFGHIYLVGQDIAVVIASISLICTLLTLFLIYDLNRWNTYMRIIFHLTLCQLIYDLAFYMFPFHDKSDNVAYFQTQLFLFSLGSVAVSLWVNLISCSLYSVVVYQENLEIHKIFNKLRIGFMLPGLAIGILFIVYVNTHFLVMHAILSWIQISSIVFNVAVHLMVSRELRMMQVDDLKDCGNQRQESKASEWDGENPTGAGTRYSEPEYKMHLYRPVSELARRLKFYPIVQVLSMVGQVWYYFEYDLHWLGSSTGTTHMIAWLCYCVLTPCAGLGYFTVFLRVQPFAYNHLMMRVHNFRGKMRSVSSQSDNYREPDTTRTRISEMRIPPRMSTISIESGTSGGDGGGGRSSFNTGTTPNANTNVTSRYDDVEIMDEEMLMEKIREIYSVQHGIPIRYGSTSSSRAGVDETVHQNTPDTGSGLSNPIVQNSFL